MTPFENTLISARPVGAGVTTRPAPEPRAEPGLAYACAWMVLKLYNLACIGEIRARGQTGLPAGPQIIAAQHPHSTDGFVLPFVLPDKLNVMAQGHLVDISLLGGLLEGARC